MNEATGAPKKVTSGISGSHLTDAMDHQLEILLSAANYDAVKTLLEPVQPVDIAEAIGSLPLV